MYKQLKLLKCVKPFKIQVGDFEYKIAAFMYKFNIIKYRSLISRNDLPSQLESGFFYSSRLLAQAKRTSLTDAFK